MPIIQERLASLEGGKNEKLPLFDAKPPVSYDINLSFASSLDCVGNFSSDQWQSDYIQWAIDHALAKPIVNSTELDPRLIACRFSVLCFAAIQSSVITLTNTLFDLSASNNCAASLSTMRDEVVKQTSNSSWSKASLARMTHVDSALRESLRLNGFIERGIMKMVVAPEGVTLPDGSHIPYGTKVGVSGYSVHHDEELYASALEYDPFRFVTPPGGVKKPLALVTTSDTFLGFSHGSHAW
jgi:cytochrome P450